MLTLTSEDILLLTVLWICTGFFNLFVFVRFGILKWAGASVIKSFLTPSDDMKAGIKNILTLGWNWFLSEPIPTGKTIKHRAEDSDEIIEEKEFVPPYIILARTITTNLKMSLLGSQSVKKGADGEMMQAIAADLQDPSNPLGGLMRSALPGALARAQKTGDYRPLLMAVFGPMVQEWIKKKQGGAPPAAGTAGPSVGDLRF